MNKGAGGHRNALVEQKFYDEEELGVMIKHTFVFNAESDGVSVLTGSHYMLRLRPCVSVKITKLQQPSQTLAQL